MFTTLIETIWLDITGVRKRVAARVAAEAASSNGGEAPLIIQLPEG